MASWARLVAMDGERSLGGVGRWEQRRREGGWNLMISCARATRTMKRCSSDARSEGQSGDSLGREGLMVQRRKQEALARANGTSRRASGWAGEKVARSERSISPHPRRDNERAWREQYCSASFDARNCRNPPHPSLLV